MQSDLFYCKVTLHFSGVTEHPSGVLRTVTTASSTGHNNCTATPLQRGQIWKR